MISVTSEGSCGLNRATEIPCSAKKPFAFARYTGAWYGIARQLKTGQSAVRTCYYIYEGARNVILSVLMVRCEEERYAAAGLGCESWDIFISGLFNPLPSATVTAFSQPDGPPTRTLSASGSVPGAWGVSREDRTIMMISNTLAGTRAGMSSVRPCQASSGPGGFGTGSSPDTSKVWPVASVRVRRTAKLDAEDA